MTDRLPPQLLQLFAPRPALRYLIPCDHAPEERVTPRVTGVAEYVQAAKDFDDGYVPTESWLQRKDRERLDREQDAKHRVTDGYKNEFNPREDPNVVGDPLRTLFVSRLSYTTEVKDLEREFGRYGPIEHIRLVEDKNNDNPDSKKKHRGYAFIVFERDSDMKAAYKDADGLRIKDRRILVDVERGRTVKEWRPRRYGGGLGGRHYTKAAPARPTGYGAPSGPGGGFRGGFGAGGAGGGGFRGGGFRGGRGGGGGGGFRGGFGGGDRGGAGFGGDRGGGDRGGGDRGGYGGGRSGVGYGSNGYPEGAPSGPRGGGRSGGYGDGGRGRDSYGGGDRGGGDRGGGSRYGDRPPRDYGGGGSGGNQEPLGGRSGGGGGGGGYRDRDFDRKRPYDGGGGGGGYDDSRKQRRY